MYKALYRSYRPEVFNQVLGQDHIIRVLSNQLKADTINHAYLFCGTRGTGKTTVARLLAKAVNCTSEGEKPCGTCDNCKGIKAGTFVDLIEIDAASNNGVENIRELRESVNYPPVVGKKKVYIMDEVHMLSSGAFNAILKTLEEPPEDVIFILCTTEPEKIPATVLSRCIRMDFKRVSEDALVSRMKSICQEEGMEVDESGLKLIAQNADGSVRDGLSILEQCISGRGSVVTREDVIEALGTVGEEFFIDITQAVIEKDIPEGILLIEDALERGKDSRQVMQGWLSHLRNLLMIKFIQNPEDVISLSIENIQRSKDQSEFMSTAEITSGIRELAAAIFDARRSSQPRVLLEMAFIKLASGDEFDNTKKAYEKRSVKTNTTSKPAAEAKLNTGKEIKPEVATSKPDSEYIAAPEDVPFDLDEAPEATAFEEALPTIELEPTVDEAPFQVPFKEEITENTSSDDSVSDQEIDKIWGEFLDRGESVIGGTFLLVREKAIPMDFKAGCLGVQVGGIVRDFMERYKSQIDQILSDIMGSPSNVKLIDEDAEATDDSEDVASKASQLLGIDVEVQ